MRATRFIFPTWHTHYTTPTPKWDKNEHNVLTSVSWTTILNKISASFSNNNFFFLPNIGGTKDGILNDENQMSLSLFINLKHSKLTKRNKKWRLRLTWPNLYIIQGLKYQIAYCLASVWTRACSIRIHELESYVASSYDIRCHFTWSKYITLPPF